MTLQSIHRKKEIEQTVSVLKTIPLIISIASFAIGTVILLLQYVEKDKNYYSKIGLYYVLIAIVINSIVFFGLILTSYFYKEHQLEIIKKAFLMLLNIPIAILYLFLVLYFFQL